MHPYIIFPRACTILLCRRDPVAGGADGPLPRYDHPQVQEQGGNLIQICQVLGKCISLPGKKILQIFRFLSFILPLFSVFKECDSIKEI